jgi:hypothetical protein
MKRSVFLPLLLTAVVLVVPALVLGGCEDLSTTGATGTSAVQSAVAGTSSTSVPSQTPAQETATTKKKTTGTAAETTVTTTLGLIAGQQILQDAFALTRYEDTDPHLTWTGSWSANNGNVYSGGTVRYTENAGSSVVIKFSGTSISWIGERGSMEGIAKVTLDGAQVALVDLYVPVNKPQPLTLWQSGTLANGSHTLKIECTHTKNPDPASDGWWIMVDAFDVFGTIN